MTQETKNNPWQYGIQVFHYLIGCLGVALFIYSAFSMETHHLDWNFLVISAVTIFFGSRVCLNIESLKTNISAVDVFVFLILLLYGSEFAVMVITIEAYITSFKFTKKFDSRLFNSGNLTISLFASASFSQFIFGNVLNMSNGITYQIVFALLVVVLTYYAINTALISISSSLRTNRNIFDTWKEDYVWTVFGFLACGSVALVAANAIYSSGLFAFLLVVPIIGIIYFSYYSQQGKLQAITEKAEQSQKFLTEITESEERFRSAFNNAPIGMALISSEGNWLQTNESIKNLFDLKSDEFTNKKFSDFVHPLDIVDFNTNFGLLIQRKIDSYHAEIRYANKSGSEIWTQTSISHANDKESSHLICQIQDITGRHNAEAKLRHDAFYDSLTDLANRTLIMQRLTSAISNAKTDTDYKFAVLFVDLDRFKLVNDSYGHNIGDKLLIAVSNRLRKCLPENSILARLGSDEFFILLESYYYDLSQIEELALEIQSQIGSDFRILTHEISVTASIGIVKYEDVHKTAEDLLRDSGAALQLAKLKGRSKQIIFDKEMREKATSQMQLEKDLQKAVERDELFLVYQPIIDLESKALNGFEALVRWNHPKIGLVSPFEFITLAEENGMIIEIGQFVLEESCRQLNEWQEEFSTDLPITISVNVSAKQLLQKHLFANVVDTLEKYKIKPQQIKLEITESVVVENTDIVLSILRQFRTLGINLSMDDFGTGYSSLSYLHQLPISTLKIDRSFIMKMTDKTETTEIIRTILLLAKNLNLSVVAEGIETKTQLEMLEQLKCDFGQGYYFAKPLTIDDATDFIRKNNENYSLYYNNLSDQTSMLLH